MYAISDDIKLKECMMTSSIQERLAIKLLEKEMIIPFPVDNDISPLFVIK